MAAPQKLTPEQEELVAEIRHETAEVRRLEADLEGARGRRRIAMKRAADAGVTVYRVAKEAETSHSSAWRILHDFDDKWAETFAAAVATRGADQVDDPPPAA